MWDKSEYIGDKILKKACALMLYYTHDMVGHFYRSFDDCIFRTIYVQKCLILIEHNSIFLRMQNGKVYSSPIDIIEYN